MSQEYSGGQCHVIPEHFSDPTPETRDMFDTAVERLQRDLADRATVIRRDYLRPFVGDIVGHRIDVACSIDERKRPTTGIAEMNARLAVSIETSDPLTATDPRVGGLLRPSKKREFIFGEVRGDMTDVEYAEAITYLHQKVAADEWVWIEKARTLASEEYDAGFLPFAVTELLDTAPPRLPVCRGKEHILEKLEFTNGMRLQIVWLEANPAYINMEQMSDYYSTIRRLTITMPTGEEYIHVAYADGTEQMLVACRDEAVRVALAVQGFAVVDPSGGMGWAAITPKQRRMGVQAPNDALMRQFSALVLSALELGTRR